jgi:MscS family membrane protein
MGIVAALGIVGLAVAFASQDTMENIIAGIFLIIDRPFREGERILLPKKIGGIYSSWGDVKEIGLRTTTVRSTDGVMLTIPNKLLTKDAVANFSHRRDMQLRVRIRLGLTPTWSNVTKAEVIIKDIAKNHPDICQEKPKPPEAVLRDFGDQDVIMEIRYYVENAKRMRPSKSFFVTEILRRFEEEKVTLAFPVRINMNSNVELSDFGF